MKTNLWMSRRELDSENTVVKVSYTHLLTGIQCRTVSFIRFFADTLWTSKRRCRTQSKSQRHLPTRDGCQQAHFLPHLTQINMLRCRRIEVSTCQCTPYTVRGLLISISCQSSPLGSSTVPGACLHRRPRRTGRAADCLEAKTPGRIQPGHGSKPGDAEKASPQHFVQ